jgi:hypothetical protein
MPEVRESHGSFQPVRPGSAIGAVSRCEGFQAAQQPRRLRAVRTYFRSTGGVKPAQARHITGWVLAPHRAARTPFRNGPQVISMDIELRDHNYGGFTPPAIGDILVRPRVIEPKATALVLELVLTRGQPDQCDMRVISCVLERFSPFVPAVEVANEIDARCRSIFKDEADPSGPQSFNHGIPPVSAIPGQPGLQRRHGCLLWCTRRFGR